MKIYSTAPTWWLIYNKTELYEDEVFGHSHSLIQTQNVDFRNRNRHWDCGTCAAVASLPLVNTTSRGISATHTHLVIRWLVSFRLDLRPLPPQLKRRARHRVLIFARLIPDTCHRPGHYCQANPIQDLIQCSIVKRTSCDLMNSLWGTSVDTSNTFTVACIDEESFLRHITRRWFCPHLVVSSVSYVLT